MSRSMVGLLAAVGAAMSALAGLTHSYLVFAIIACASAATGLAAYGALPVGVALRTKKILLYPRALGPEGVPLAPCR
jgi:hypothetical protein